MTAKSTSTSKPTIAFFGATGGCAGTALALSLKAGYTCRALARSAQKLTSLLIHKGVSQDEISANLTIIEGNIKDLSAVKRTLIEDGKIVDTIITGIGNPPPKTILTLHPLAGFDPTLCADAMRTILTALKELATESDNPRNSQKPLICAISTTGITDGPRDVPLLMLPLYWAILEVPHKDKRAMEDVLFEAASETAGEEGKVIRGAVAARPALLTDGPARNEVRVGLEGSPAVGWTVSREDVGIWLFDNIVRREGGGWIGEKVSLTA